MTPEQRAARYASKAFIRVDVATLTQILYDAEREARNDALDKAAEITAMTDTVEVGGNGEYTTELDAEEMRSRIGANILALKLKGAP